jgi:hypothetical protein
MVLLLIHGCGIFQAGIEHHPQRFAAVDNTGEFL